MPVLCCVPGCHSRNDRDFHVSFFKFPWKDPSLKKEWIKHIKRDPGPNFKLGKHTTVCSLHFNADEIKTCKSKRILKSSAIPSKFPFTTHNEDVIKKKRKSPRKRCAPESQIPFEGASAADEPTVSYSTDHQYFAETENERELKVSLNEASEEIERLKEEIAELQAKQFFSIDSVRGNDNYIHHVTGFKSFKAFETFFKCIEPHIVNMKYWTGKDTLMKEEQSFPKTKRTLSTINEFFLTLARLRRGWSEKDLAIMFGISPSTVNSILITWINLLYFVLGSLPIWPTKEIVASNMPDSFKRKYPNTRVIIDGTEVFVERASSLTRQSAMYSNYKSHTTMKGLVGISPDQAITFVSELYEGSIPDKALTLRSGFLNLLEPGDEVMADKGFNIEKELKSRGANLVMPPRKGPAAQMSKEDVQKTRDIANVRIYVENAIRRIKCFKIFDGVVPLSLFGCISQMWVVCALLTNYM